MCVENIENYPRIKNEIIDLESENTPVVERIENFFNSIDFDFLTNDIDALKKLLQLVSQIGYKFREITPKPSIADCINIMIRDYNLIKESKPKLGHFYNAMILEFLQRGMKVIGAEKEHIDHLDEKIIADYNIFKTA